MDRVATIRFNSEWQDYANPISSQEVRETAKHEVLHLLLGELSCMSGSRYVTQDELLAAEEAIVHRLMKIIAGI